LQEEEISNSMKYILQKHIMNDNAATDHKSAEKALPASDSKKKLIKTILISAPLIILIIIATFVSVRLLGGDSVLPTESSANTLDLTCKTIKKDDFPRSLDKKTWTKDTDGLQGDDIANLDKGKLIFPLKLNFLPESVGEERFNGLLYDGTLDGDYRLSLIDMDIVGIPDNAEVRLGLKVNLSDDESFVYALVKRTGKHYLASYFVNQGVKIDYEEQLIPSNELHSIVLVQSNGTLTAGYSNNYNNFPKKFEVIRTTSNPSGGSVKFGIYFIGGKANYNAPLSGKTHATVNAAQIDSCTSK
jgi:hypothetical protein